MINRYRPTLAPMVFILVFINLACSAFFTFYWLKDNAWSLDPRWLSDTDYRAIQTSTATTYATSDGQTIVLPSDPIDRKKMIASYQLTTPDGRWHGAVSTNREFHTLQTWMGLAVPVSSVCLVGLFFTLPVTKKPAPVESERELIPAG